MRTFDLIRDAVLPDFRERVAEYLVQYESVLLDKDITDTTVANDTIKAEWEQIRARHPGVDLDFSGELEDIEESLAAMQVLFLLGIGLIYLILAAQFKSYWQPLMILVSVPLAFTGVAYGLALSGNPLSLYTLYGVIALTGIRFHLGDQTILDGVDLGIAPGEIADPLIPSLDIEVLMSHLACADEDSAMNAQIMALIKQNPEIGRRMAGRSGCSVCTRRMNSMPSTPGIWRSVTSRSDCSKQAPCSAASALSQPCTS